MRNLGVRSRVQGLADLLPGWDIKTEEARKQKDIVGYDRNMLVGYDGYQQNPSGGIDYISGQSNI